MSSTSFVIPDTADNNKPLKTVCQCFFPTDMGHTGKSFSAPWWMPGSLEPGIPLATVLVRPPTLRSALAGIGQTSA